MKKVIILFGTRPEAIKMIPVIKDLKGREGVKVVVVFTGQHRELVELILRDYGIEPDHRLDLMTNGQGLCGFSARLLEALPEVFSVEKPDLVLVQGDTGTALIGGLAAFYQRVPVGHVEAGLRTGNLSAPFPEEGNRAMLSRIAQFHFAPTRQSRENLLRENVPEEAVFVTGNTVIDALMIERDEQGRDEVGREVDKVLDPLLGRNWRKKSFALITGHRRENIGAGFLGICDAIVCLAERYGEMGFVYPVHLNPGVKRVVEDRLSGYSNIYLLPPLSYRPFVALLGACEIVLTDSGGVQEEAPGFGKPVLVMRDTTERPEGVEAGTVRLVGSDCQRIVREFTKLMDDRSVYEQMSAAVNPYGDGTAARQIGDVVTNYLGT